MTPSTANATKSAGPFLERFKTARKRATLYPREHEYVSDAVRDLLDSIRELLAGDLMFTVTISNGELYLEGRLLSEESLSESDLIAELVELQLTSLTISAGVRADELTRFIEWTNRAPEDVRAQGGWEQLLRRQGLDHIGVDRKIALGDTWNSEHVSENMKVSRDVYRKAIETALHAYMDARARQMVNAEMIEGVVHLLVTAISDNTQIMSALSQIRSNDEYTLSHSVNVAILSLLMGSKLRLPRTLLHQLGVAALLHDIGKTCVSEDIINKPEQLTSEEWKLMQSHCMEGARILSEQEAINPLSLVVAAEHHAREDLTGYPAFHALRRLHSVSKIVSIVDTYDALTSNRSYRRAMGPDQAMRILIDGRGTHFNEAMLKVFAQLTGMFPVGTLVELDSGERGVVMRANPNDLYRPEVKVISDADTHLTEFRILDLAARNDDGTYIRTILRSVEPEIEGVNLATYF